MSNIDHTYEPVEGIANQWLREDGLLLVGREGQTLESLVGELAEPAPPPASVIVVQPADLWRRASEEEAEKIEAAMAAQSAKLRNLFQRAATFQSDDALWLVLTGAATQLFGAARAAELLAPSI